MEAHNFDPVKVLQWRTSRFDFSSVEALLRSLETPAPIEGLAKALPAVDQQAREICRKTTRLCGLQRAPSRIELLWDACALPDYRKIAPAQHADIVQPSIRILYAEGALMKII